MFGFAPELRPAGERRPTAPIGLKLYVLLMMLLLLIYACPGSQAKLIPPEPELYFTVQPSDDDTPLYVSKNTPVLLHCAAKFTGNSSSNDEIEYRIVYRWLQNGAHFGTAKSHGSADDGRTLRLGLGAKVAYGHFRCVAEGSKIHSNVTVERVAIVSRPVHVQRIEFHKVTAPKETTAFAGGSVLLVCPFVSVPRANVSWSIANTIEMAPSSYTQLDPNDNRFIKLTNGSMLLVHVRVSDTRRYRCIAHNSHKPERDSTILLQVLPATPIESKNELLPLLQSQDITLIEGESMNLLCAGVRQSNVSWTTTVGPLSVDAGNILRLDNVTQLNNGVYNCSTTDDYQVFNVLVATMPVITKAPVSLRGHISSVEHIACVATGHPEPKVSWYRDGELLQQDLNVRINATHLSINSYESEHQGIYQCVAENAAGETQASAMLSWTASISQKAVTDVKCYPFNYTHFLVGFQAESKIRYIVAYTASERSSDQWMSQMSVQSPVPDKYLIRNFRPQFEAFTLFVRFPEATGIKNGDICNEMSPLSKGVPCAGQGLELSAIVHSTGIFVWWPKAFGLNVTHLTIEFRQIGPNMLPPRFTSEIVGTRSTSIEKSSWQQIEAKLINIPANVSREHERQSTSVNVTELQVPGYVTGILIPNTKQVMMRVILPVLDEESGIELVQDHTYLQWSTIPAQSITYFTEVAAHSISIRKTGTSNLSCLRVCVASGVSDQRCVVFDHTEIKINMLQAETRYMVTGYECDTKVQVVQFDEVTKAKVDPEPVHNIIISRGFPISMKWSVQDQHQNSATRIAYFAIQWSKNGNETKSVNVSAESRSFDFPDTTNSDLLNISIRSAGQRGTGIPVYYDMNTEQQNMFSANSPHTTQNDPTLGIVIGTLLSVICIIVCFCVIVWHRRLVKRRQASSPDATSTSPNMSRSPVIKNGVYDLHEMETLIHKPMAVSVYNVLDRISRAPSDGLDAGTGQHILRQGGDSLMGPTDVMIAPNVTMPLDETCEASSNEPGEGSSDGKYGFILSSTPKREHSDEVANAMLTNLECPSLPIANGQPSSPIGCGKSKHSSDVAYAKPSRVRSKGVLAINNNETSAATVLKLSQNGIAQEAQIILPLKGSDSIFPSLDQSCGGRLLHDESSTPDITSVGGVLDESVESTMDDAVDLLQCGRKPINTWSCQRPLVGPNG